MDTTAPDAPRSSKPLVLSVDDEPNIARAIKRTLRRADVEVLTANSGPDALALMDDNTFDVIISDMRMPQMSGASFLSAAAEIQPDARRVLLTGYADLQSTIDAINLGGVSTYLTKPWDDDHLISVVKDAVKLKRLSSRNQELEQLKVDLESSMQALAESQETMVALLANAIGIRDRVGADFNEPRLDLALAMGDRAGMSTAELKDLRRAILLHRIGRLSIPDDLLIKPYLSMGAEERDTFNQHPVYADAVLMGLTHLERATLWIGHQLEQWDGHGYPEGKAGEDIPLGAYIIAICRDYFDLQAGLIEPNEMSASAAQEHIVRQSGARYAPDAVAYFEAEISLLSDRNLAVKAIEVDALSPGMTLARDLTTSQGVLLLSKGERLNADLIKKVQRINRATAAGTIYVVGE